MRIAIHGRDAHQKSTQFIESVIEYLTKQGVEVTMSDKFLQTFHSPRVRSLKIKSFGHDVNLSRVDFFLSIGGDGTLLESVTYVGKSGVPILGINTGRLGFLATISREGVRSAIDNLLEGNFNTDERTLLHLTSDPKLFEGIPFALNDLTIMKKDSSSMITVHVFVDGELLNSYWADGVIVATPTGSTGYSLSCGGPLIYPHSESLVITPVSPHNLAARPIVISDIRKFRDQLSDRRQKQEVSCLARFEIRVSKRQREAHRAKGKVQDQAGIASGLYVLQNTKAEVELGIRYQELVDHLYLSPAMR
jgi:NAD+ kinase